MYLTRINPQVMREISMARGFVDRWIETPGRSLEEPMSTAKAIIEEERVKNEGMPNGDERMAEILTNSFRNRLEVEIHQRILDDLMFKMENSKESKD